MHAHVYMLCPGLPNVLCCDEEKHVVAMVTSVVVTIVYGLSYDIH